MLNNDHTKEDQGSTKNTRRKIGRTCVLIHIHEPENISLHLLQTYRLRRV
jgi:hypothetical protein